MKHNLRIKEKPSPARGGTKVCFPELAKSNSTSLKGLPFLKITGMKLSTQFLPDKFDGAAMFLDTFNLQSLVFQMQYAHAFEIWDRAGAVSRRLKGIWPKLEVLRGEPQIIILKAPGVTVRTEIATATLTFNSLKNMDARTTQQIAEAVDVWLSELGIEELQRVSMRVNYTKNFPTLRDANAALFGLQLARWPDQKVFDQPLDGSRNGLEISYRFEDENTFTVLRLKAEGLTYEQQLDPEFFEEETLAKEINRVVLDFDRGLLRSIDARKFLTEDWIKGYFHVLRRDIDKVVGSHL